MKKLLLSVAFLSSSLFLFSQCKSFTKKNCLPSLTPFASNGQINAAKLAPGEAAELQINFSKGLKYRLLLCSSDLLGEVEMKVLDKNRKELFSDAVEENVAFWDFDAESTQLLTIQITTPKGENQNELVGLGCVTMLAGFRE
mgnify:CR=1 FL=1|tara:strand:- start:3505 stop:3930 length:426 start_codon:yes stop_codon:yes gene_type:complete